MLFVLLGFGVKLLFQIILLLHVFFLCGGGGIIVQGLRPDFKLGPNFTARSIKIL